VAGRQRGLPSVVWWFCWGICLARLSDRVDVRMRPSQRCADIGTVMEVREAPWCGEELQLRESMMRNGACQIMVDTSATHVTPEYRGGETVVTVGGWNGDEQLRTPLSG
jgi:hypothetical protein